MLYLIFLFFVGVISLVIYINYFDDVVYVPSNGGQASLGWWWKGNFEIIAECTHFGSDHYWVNIMVNKAYSFDQLSGKALSVMELHSYTIDKNESTYPILFDSYNSSGEIWWYILTIKGIEKADGVQLRLKNTRWRQKPIIERNS